MAKDTIGTQTGANYENPFLTYAGYTTEAIREIWNWQFKTGQAYMDQAVRFGQTQADYVQSQMAEGSKLTQECIKMGTHFADECRKSFTGVAEKILKTQ